MKIDLDHKCFLLGHDITVKITDDGDIARVVTTLDDDPLADDLLDVGHTLYERFFALKGTQRAGASHRLSVTVFQRGGDDKKQEVRATRFWSDPS